MSYPTKNFKRSPISRPLGPVRYTYSDAEDGGVKIVSVSLEASKENSYDTLTHMLGLIELVKSELLWKIKKYLPWRVPYNGPLQQSSEKRGDLDDREDPDERDGSYGDEFRGVPSR